MENSTEAGEISAHASAEEFLMIMIHYSWITLLVLFMLGACSYYSYKKQPTGRRTTQVGTEIRVRHSPGVLAHGGYPFIVRGVIGTTFFMLAILPLFLIICSTIIGLILAVVEGWEAGIGVEYLLSNVLGMSSPLTSVVPEDTFGIHFAIIMNMYAVIMVTTAMGLVANMSLMAAITEKVPQSASGFFWVSVCGGPSRDVRCHRHHRMHHGGVRGLVSRDRLLLYGCLHGELGQSGYKC